MSVYLSANYAGQQFHTTHYCTSIALSHDDSSFGLEPSFSLQNPVRHVEVILQAIYCPQKVDGGGALDMLGFDRVLSTNIFSTYRWTSPSMWWMTVIVSSRTRSSCARLRPTYAASMSLNVEKVLLRSSLAGIKIRLLLESEQWNLPSYPARINWQNYSNHWAQRLQS